MLTLCPRRLDIARLRSRRIKSIFPFSFQLSSACAVELDAPDPNPRSNLAVCKANQQATIPSEFLAGPKNEESFYESK